MGVIIDTNIVVFWEKDPSRVLYYIQGKEEEEFFISVISASELLHGIYRAANPIINARRKAFVEGILTQFPILSIDLLTARTHAQLWANMQATGQMIGLHDSWIAAQCIARGYSLVTHNIREFQQVPGLVVEQWTR